MFILVNEEPLPHLHPQPDHFFRSINSAVVALGEYEVDLLWVYREQDLMGICRFIQDEGIHKGPAIPKRLRLPSNCNPILAAKVGVMLGGLVRIET